MNAKTAELDLIEEGKPASGWQDVCCFGKTTYRAMLIRVCLISPAIGGAIGAVAALVAR